VQTLTSSGDHFAELSVDGSQLVHEDQPGVPGAAEAGDAFGASLSAGEAKLYIGGPGETVRGAPGAGAVTAFFAYSVLEPHAQFHQDTSGFAGDPEPDDAFGGPPFWGGAGNPWRPLTFGALAARM
jgi:hypothetical protein